MNTQTMDEKARKARIEEIRAELDQIAPLPEDGEVSATALRLHLAMEAQLAWARLTSMTCEITKTDIAIVQGYFAAAHALDGLVSVGEQPGGGCDVRVNLTAAQIRDALFDAGGTGEWLYEHLGPAARRVATLAEEMADLSAAAPEVAK
jgi:hypothetical protein